jgi:hypothetical protein
MTATDLIQAIAMVVLVGITVFYAWQAKKASDNAAASVKETKEQRLGEAQPYLLLRLQDEAILWNEVEQGKRPSTEFSITIRNEGKGPAINIWAALWSLNKIYYGDSKGYLAPKEEWATTISRRSVTDESFKKGGWLAKLGRVVKHNSPGIVAVEYKDIHHRTWVSYLRLELHHSVNGSVMEGEQNIVELNNEETTG